MSGKRKRIYSTYERTWHWIQMIAVVVLLATGFHIHAPVRLPLADLAAIVWLHNVFGFILIGNALLGLFYFVTTAPSGSTCPEPQGLRRPSPRRSDITRAGYSAANPTRPARPPSGG